MENSSKNSHPLTPEEEIKEWEIDSKTAKKMMDHRKDPGYDTSNIVDYNDKIRHDIDVVLPDGNKTWQPARYKDEDDEKRYCRLRKIPDEGGQRGKSGRVKDYKTMIYMVVDTSKPVESTTYYDIATINPPPPVE